MEEIELTSFATRVETHPDSEETNLSGKPNYQTLPPKHIRVLNILPVNSTSDYDSSPIITKLRTIDLRNNPKFTALSYVWGNYAPEPEFITCDGVQFRVTTNCHSVLKHLRKNFGELTIWVDAVCINQDDAPEKEHQIPLMGEIYTLAETVYAWLGDGTVATDRAMRYMAKGGFTEFFEMDGIYTPRPYAAAWEIFRSGWSRNRHATLISDSTFKRYFLSGTSEQYTHICDVEYNLSSVWIERVWTYQEILLASNPVIVRGDIHVPWSRFERAIITLEESTMIPRINTKPWFRVAFARERSQRQRQVNSSLDLQLYSDFTRQTSRALQRIHNILYLSAISVFVGLYIAMIVQYPALRLHRASSYNWISIVFATAIISLVFMLLKDISTRRPSSHQEFSEYILDLYTRTTTEAKDYAYSMWAVLERGGIINLPTPNYSNTTSAIYQTFAFHIVQLTKSLDILLLAAIKGNPGKPSWVPDWAAHEKIGWIDAGYKQQITDDYGYHIFTTFLSRSLAAVGHGRQPTIRTESQFQFDDTERILAVKARQVCNVRRCFQFHYMEDLFNEDSLDLHLENVVLMLTAVKGRGFLTAIRTIVEKSQGTQILSDSLRRIELEEWMYFRKGTSRAGRHSLVSFYRKHAVLDPMEVLRHLRTQSDLLATHITLCNILALLPITLCFVNSPGSPEREVLGLCSCDVEGGDQILRFDGVSQLLIVREYPEGVGKGIRIISPLLVLTLFKRGWFQKRAEMPWEEYNIY